MIKLIDGEAAASSILNFSAAALLLNMHARADGLEEDLRYHFIISSRRIV